MRATQPTLKALDEKAMELLVELLYVMASALGYEFDKVQLRRGAYFPRLLSEDAVARLEIRNNLVKLLSGQQPIPMAVMSLPVSQEVTEKQQQLSDAPFGCAYGQ
jgi:hypothetical protein